MSRERSKTHPGADVPRPARRIHAERPGKLPDLARCPSCGASYRDGRWTWKHAPADAYEARCPACERIETHYPDGVLQVRGAFAEAHREEIVGLLRNLEERERAEHPLKRIIAIADDEGGFDVTVTEAKLARSFGRALEKAYSGRLDQPGTSADPGGLARVHWTRD